MKPPADMVDYYKEQGKFATVNGEQSLEAVTRDLLAALEIASGDRNKV
jgi:adenylate kinase family enzyme